VLFDSEPDLSSYFYDFSIKDKSAGVLESELESNPNDVRARVRLLGYYFRTKQVSKRFKLILWFIRYRPDWKVCGTRAMALAPSEEESNHRLSQIWIEQIANSDSLMRRVNYYLFLAATNAKYQSDYAELFAKYPNSLWSLALKDIDSQKQHWLETLIQTERNKPFATQEEERALVKTSRGDGWKKQLSQISLESDPSEFSKIATLSEEDQNFENAITVAAYTWGRVRLDSIIGFDPEVLAERLKLISWLVRKAPSSKFARNVFFVAPFNQLQGSQIGGSNWLAASRFVGELWLNQIKHNPQSRQTAINSMRFANAIKKEAPSIAEPILLAIAQGKQPCSDALPGK